MHHKSLTTLLTTVLLAGSLVSLTRAAEIEMLNVSNWLANAAPLNNDDVFEHGHVRMISGYGGNHFLRDARRVPNVIDILGEQGDALAIEGFTFGRGNFRVPAQFLKGVKATPDDPLSVTWVQESRRNYISLIFICLEDVRTADTTGEEAVSIYHNDYKLGTYIPGNRTALPYVYPYSDLAARDIADMPREVNWEDNFARQIQYGVLVRQRRNFLKGDQLRIVAETPGSYRISAIMLVPYHDTVEILQPGILHPSVKLWDNGRQPRGQAGNLQFTWVTRLPSRSILMWNTDRQQLEDGRGYVFREEVYSENHQHYANLELAPGETVYYRILAENNDGRRTATDILSYTCTPRPAQTAQGRIELLAMDPVRQAASPAYASAPLEAEQVVDLDCVRVVKVPDGEAVPAQLRAVCRYPDGAVRWLGAEFTAEPDVRYAVEYGPDIEPVAAQGGLEIAERDDGQVVVSGDGVQAVFHADAPAGLARIAQGEGDSLNLTPESMRLVQTNLEGKRFSAGTPSVFEIEESGPHKVTVRAEGHFEAEDGEPLMHYIVRWRLYRDYPGLDIELTVGNDRDEDKYACFPPDDTPDSAAYPEDKPLNWYFVKIDDLYLELDLAEPRSVSVGSDGAWSASPEPDFRLFQRDHNVVLDGAEESSEARLDGRLFWQGENQSLGIRFDRFWQQYPKSFERRGKTLRVGIMPAFEPSAYPDERLDEETNTFHRWSNTTRLWFYLREGHYRFMYGVQKTHRFSLVFGDEARDCVSEERVLPPTAFFVPAPANLCASRVFGDFYRILPDDGSYPAVNAWIDRAVERIKGRQGADFGMLNFGDVWGERTWKNWLGCGHFGPARSYTREFFRTGRRDMLNLAWEAAMHFADVDTIHYGPNRGFQVSHAVGHTGNEYLRQDGLNAPGYPNTFHAGHHRIGGIRAVAALTGSPRLREVADLGGERRGRYISGLQPTQVNRGKNVGYQFRIYELEGNPFNLNGARIEFDRMVFDLDPWTGTGYTNVPLGYREATGDSRVDELMAIRTRKVPWDDHLKLKVACPWHSVRQMRVTPEPEAMGGEAFLVTADPEARHLLEDHMTYALSIEPDGALVHLVDRFGRAKFFSWTYYLDAAGIDDVQPKELPEEAKKHYDANLRMGLGK